ncbi:M56 family metallopeptidase [Amedibacillus sp. YH-ame10]
MNPLFKLFNYKLIFDITFWQIILLIWISGSVVYSSIFIQQILSSFRIIRRLQKKSTPYRVCDFFDLCDNDYQIFVSDLISSPMVFGFKKIIFLPNIEFSEVDLKNIIYHEIQHIKNYDSYIKLFLNVLVVIYWWFPPIYILKKNIALFIEIRVDDQVTKNMSAESRVDYTNSLIDVQKKIEPQAYRSLAFSSFIDDSAYILSYRIHYLLDGAFIKKTKSIFLFSLFIVSIISYMFIFEPAYYNGKETEGTLTLEDINTKGIITHKRNGTYTLTFNGKNIDFGYTIPEDFKNVLIIEESEGNE